LPRAAFLIQINGQGHSAAQSARMRSIADRLAEVIHRIADGERRLAELQGPGAEDDAVTAVLIENVTATLKLLRDHQARLERHRGAAKVDT
jgi:hypothetical protein